MAYRLSSLLRLSSTCSTATLALVLLAASPATAETQLQEIIVDSAQAGGLGSNVIASGSSFSVVTRNEIERRGIAHAADALKALPGVSVSQTGGAGGIAQVRLRGAEARHTKVLIDGVEVNGMDDGSYDFATLLAVDIERIEVLRGPQSGVHGGNALAGAINIVTRKDGKPGVSLSAEGGSLNTRLLTGNLSTGNGDGYLSISGAVKESDGFNVAETGNEADGARQDTVFARAGYAFSPLFRLDGMVRHQNNDSAIDSDTDFDGKPNDVAGYSSEREQTLANLSGTFTLFDGLWVQKLDGSYFGDGYAAPTPSSRYSNDGERRKVSYLNQFNLTTGPLRHTLNGVVEHSEERFTTSSLASYRERGQTGYVGEYRLNYLDRLHLDGNLRYDDNDSLADVTTWRLGASYSLQPLDTRLHSSYGKGIQNPTMFGLYGFANNYIANPNLLPEESIGWDIGLEQGLFDRRVVVDTTYFESDLTNKIGSTRIGGVFSPINQSGTGHRKGVEVTASYAVADWLSLGGSYTYTRATASDQREEPRRPEHRAGVDLTTSFAEGRGKVNVEALYRGDIVDDNFGTTPASRVSLADYAIVNLAAAYRLTDSVELFARGENLLDADYQEVYGYESAPLVAYAGVKLKLDAAK